MGYFSWCTSDTQKSIPSCIPFGDLPGTVYLLNPFGEPYKESFYDGFGEFGGRDVYELVAEWNREYLTPDNITKPDRSDYAPGADGEPYFARAMESYQVKCEAIKAYAAGASDEFMQEQYGKQLGYGGFAPDWKRIIGIAIACADENHVKLKYPIKIVENPVPYDQAKISPGCPFQGCFYPDSELEMRKQVREAFADLAKEEQKWKASQRKDPLANQVQTAASRTTGEKTTDTISPRDR